MFRAIIMYRNTRHIESNASLQHYSFMSLIDIMVKVCTCAAILFGVSIGCCNKIICIICNNANNCGRTCSNTCADINRDDVEKVEFDDAPKSNLCTNTMSDIYDVSYYKREQMFTQEHNKTYTSIESAEGVMVRRTPGSCNRRINRTRHV